MTKATFLRGWLLVRQGMSAGVLIGVAVALVWAAVIALRTPEPSFFLAAVRHQDGQQWDIENCADCPAFLLLDRGFGSPHEPLPITALAFGSLPSVLVSVDRGGASLVPEVRPLRFFAAIILQWALAAFVVRCIIGMLVSRKLAKATPQGVASRRTKG